MVLIVESHLSAGFDLLITSEKRVNIPDVQKVLLSWILQKNELKSTMHLSKLYDRVK